MTPAYVVNSLDDIGACVAAIRALTENAGGLDQESTRAVYSLTCMATAAWRLLDEEADKAPVRSPSKM